MYWLCNMTTRLVVVVVCALFVPHGTGRAALVLVPDAGTVAPGEAFAVDLTLTDPYGQPFDWLRMSMQYDSAALTAMTVEPGPLLSEASLDANPDRTLAEATFVLPPDPFGPGVIARWRFTVNPQAVPGTTQLQAALIGLDLDDQPNLPLPSAPLLITIVPEPASLTLLLIGFAMLIAAARRRLSRPPPPLPSPHPPEGREIITSAGSSRPGAILA